MKKILWGQGHTPLFAGVEPSELNGMLVCLSAQKKQFEKNEMIVHVGDKAGKIGLVLSGTVQVIKEDALGNRSILGMFEQGELFGEAFSCAGTERFPVSVMASSDCEIMLLDYKKIITTCSSDCLFHHKLIENMLAILAKKNLIMNQKIECLSKRSIREKLLAFLMIQAEQKGQAGKDNVRFEIPFNRQELADYLCVDRSALSKELGRMQEEGILKFNKDQFTLYI